MKSIWFCFSLMLWSGMLVQAQDNVGSLPLSLEYHQAIQKRTRSENGASGINYFQNRAAYKINGSFDPDSNQLEAVCHIKYYNDSPDTLDEIVIRLLQNYYKPRAERDDPLDEEDFASGLIFDKFMVEGEPYEDAYIFEESSTNLSLKLKSPLYPKDTIGLEITYHFKVTSTAANRMGQYKDDAFFIAYWYPQIAVYDDIFGWDRIPYLGKVEFYQTVADFEVSMQLPKGFMMWGTGLLQEAEEVLSEPILEKYKAAMLSDTVVNIISKEDYKNGEILTQEDSLLTWHFIGREVPDFAFAVSDYYYWDGSSMVIDSPSRRIFVDACYHPRAKDFRKVANFAKQSIEDLSTQLPGIPYPYPAMTVFNGDQGLLGGGMEFPMIVNDGSTFNEGSGFRLTYHEIAHTYFPFYTGINERRFAWMDEGWASYLPIGQMKERGYDKTPMSSNVNFYRRFSGTASQVPLMRESHQVSSFPYYVQAYYHSSTAYHMLRSVMGDTLFREALQTYIRRWAGKHPHPQDFFNTFEDVAGEDLDWFWKPWFYETGAADLALENVNIKNKKVTFEVGNTGRLPVPIHLTYTLEGGKKVEERISARVWKDKEKVSLKRKFKAKVKKLRLGDSDIPDKTSSNNK